MAVEEAGGRSVRVASAAPEQKPTNDGRRSTMLSEDAGGDLQLVKECRHGKDRLAVQGV
jgi:hypothetical protein